MKKIAIMITSLFTTTVLADSNPINNGERLFELFNNTINNKVESVQVYQPEVGKSEYYVRVGGASAQFYASKYEVHAITKLIAEGKLKKMKKFLKTSRSGAKGRIFGYKVTDSFVPTVQDKNKFIEYINR